MADRYTRRILSHMTDRRYVPRQVEQLARDLSIEPHEHDDFRNSVEQLIDEGQIVLSSAQTVALPPPGAQMVGTFRRARGGFGFIVPDSAREHGDLYVPASNTAGALTGDLVRAQVQHRNRRAGAGRSPYIGCIVEILQRADRHFVGNLGKQGSLWMVWVDGHRMHEPVIVRDPHAKNARRGDKVVIEILRYPQADAPAEGVITEILGEQGQPDVETFAVMRAYGLPEQFPQSVLAEARAVASGFDSLVMPQNREDITNRSVLTIDPPDARDFDDAISVIRLDESTEEAAYELAVHIADVSHFVAPGSALDEEAAQRANSVYLPRRVIPMLPEVLSNGACSLQEDVNRYCKSVFLRYDAAGQVCGQRLARTVIRSTKRLTYREAQAVIDDDVRQARQHAMTRPSYPQHLITQLKLMDELARLIQRRRLRDGMIVLDLPEVQLLFDDSGRVLDVHPQDHSFTHTIIEMFMVEANEAAARLFDAMNVPMIRRVHAEPPAHDMKQLRQFARVAGYNVPSNPTRAELQVLLDAVRGKPTERAIHLAVLKTMSRAEYSPMRIGHFALAADHYTHFTSPIRRYPDLVVHCAMDAYLDLAESNPSGRGGPRRFGSELRKDPRLRCAAEVALTATHCSACERNAEAAEHDLRKYLVLELLGEHLGDDFDGTVTGVVSSGVFIQLDRYLVDGFIRVSDLQGLDGYGGRRWRLNLATGTLVAQGSGKAIAIGDRFVVRIAQVQPAARQLDLVLVDAHKPGCGGSGKKTRRCQPRGAARSHRQSMQLKRIRKRDRR